MLKFSKLICFSIVLAMIAAFTGFDNPQEYEARAPISADVPIIMYHNVSDKRSSLGKYVISPEEFEADLLYLKENGYTTVTMHEIIAFAKKGKRLPEKPIVLTFDDGSRGLYEHAFPLLQKHNMRAVAAIIGDATDKYSEETPNASHPHVTWDKVREMADSKLVEFQNHSYNLHIAKGAYHAAKKGSGEGVEAYRTRLTDDLSKFQTRLKEKTGKTATTFVYPFGALSAESDEILRDIGFSATLTCHNKIATITAKEPEGLFSLPRLIRPHGKSLENVLKSAQN